VLKDFKESAKVIGETTYGGDPSPKVKSNKLAIVEIMTVYTWTILVDAFGNIPYSEALDIEIPSPKYDDAFTIYKDLATRLNTAIATLDPAWGSLDDADNVYQGDVSKWIKFANSLKLKMGLTLADKDGAYAKTLVEAAAPNVFLSNADNASFVYLASAPNQNPLYEDLVASGRNDFVPTSAFIDFMNALNDPRRPFYFTFAPDTNIYIGGPNGVVSAFTDYSHVADAMLIPTLATSFIDYAEVEFLLAEAVIASILYWGGTVSDATTYLANPDVAYSTATGTYKEKIGNQLWIAMYNRGFEAWTYWRKLDFPVLTPAPDAVPESNGEVPVRLTYPTAEQTLNGTSYDNAAIAIGGDYMYTKLFWDKY
jgi:hypothetical protein